MSIKRIDRGIALSLHALASGLKLRRTPRLPVLMYHSIGNRSRPGHPYYETNTSAEVFRSHLQYLSEKGFTVIDVNEISKAMDSGQTKLRVAITFDDGFRDFHSNALPLLAEFGFKATIYVISAIPDDGRAGLHGKELMTWDEIREVHRHGISIGSHTVNHPKLEAMAPDAIEYELGVSKATIESKLGAQVQSFAYPFAFPETQKVFTQRLRDMLQKVGYENGVTTSIGTVSAAHDRFFYPRLPANSFDDIRFLEAKLAGSYDWMHVPQYLFKRGKGVRQTTASREWA